MKSEFRIDVDRPSTWKAYTKDKCRGCTGACCTMPVEVRLSDLIRLELVTEDEAAGSIKKMAKRLIREGILASYRQGTDLYMLAQKANSDCQFLDANRLCKVYEKRPDTCRDFPSVGPRPGFCPGTKK